MVDQKPPEIPKPEGPPEGAPASAEALTFEQVQAQAEARKLEGLKRGAREDLVKEVEGGQAIPIVEEAPTVPSPEQAKESSFWASLLSGILTAKNSVMDFLNNLGTQIRDGVAKLFGLKETGQEVAKEAGQKLLDLLTPNAPLFSFPKEWLGAAIQPRLSDVRRIRLEHPVTRQQNVPHEGVDIDLPEGTPIVVTTRARVIESTKGDSAGYYVTVQLDDGRKASFMHLQQSGPVQETVLEPGDVLGYVGSTGRASGPHLHFEVDGGGSDPLPYLDPSMKSSAAALVAQLQAEGKYQVLA